MEQKQVAPPTQQMKQAAKIKAFAINWKMKNWICYDDVHRGPNCCLPRKDGMKTFLKLKKYEHYLDICQLVGVHTVECTHGCVLTLKMHAERITVLMSQKCKNLNFEFGSSLSIYICLQLSPSSLNTLIETFCEKVLS